MSKPRTSKSDKIEKSGEKKKKSSVLLLFKQEKKDVKSGEYKDLQYVIGDKGITIKAYIKKGDNSDKVTIKSQPDGKYLLTVFKNGAKEKETEHSVDEIKKYLEKNKDFAFFDQIKSLTVKKGGSKKRVSVKRK